MAKVTLIVCDHCDARENVDDVRPFGGGIRKVKVILEVEEQPPASWVADLCSKCRGEISQHSGHMTMPMPRAAEAAE